MEKKLSVLVGDANGIDKSVQVYLHKHEYKDVCVFASQGDARNNTGCWSVFGVDVNNNRRDFDFFAAKDKKMAEVADCGFMIWNGISKGTLNNIVNMINYKKKVLVYLTTKGEFYNISTMEGVKRLTAFCGSNTRNLLDTLVNTHADNVYLKESNQINFLDGNK